MIVEGVACSHSVILIEFGSFSVSVPPRRRIINKASSRSLASSASIVPLSKLQTNLVFLICCSTSYVCSLYLSMKTVL